MPEFLAMQWRTLALDATIKATVLFLAAGMAVLCLRRASAASRHLVWLFTFGGLLTLPLLSAALPGWRLSLSPQAVPASWATRLLSGAAAWHLVPPDSLRRGRTDIPPGSPPFAGVPGGGAKRGPASRPGSGPALRAPAPGPRVCADHVRFVGTGARNSRPGSGLASALRQASEWHGSLLASVQPRLLPRGSRSWAGPAAFRGLPGLAWGFLLWLVVAALVLARSAAGLAQLGRIRQRCRGVTAAPVTALADQLARELGLRRPVTLIHGLLDGPPAIPMTWGFRRPIVLLPTGFAGWPEERQRAVLLHELAHVKRADWLVLLLARVACALYWFHPLVWWAARRLRVESEQACDDHVLIAGIKASDYATHLLAVVRSTRLSRGSLRAAVSMARGPLVETRLRAILDGRRSRKATPRRASVLAWVAAVGILPPLAAVRVSARTPATPAAALPASTATLPARSSAASTVQVEIHEATPANANPSAPAVPSSVAEPARPSPAAPPKMNEPPVLGLTLPPSLEESADPAAAKAAAPARRHGSSRQGSGTKPGSPRHAVLSLVERDGTGAEPADVERTNAEPGTAEQLAAELGDTNRSDTKPGEPNLADKDLSGADLSGRDLSGKDLSGKDLSGANLSGAKLTGANLSGSDLSGANLAHADLSHAKMTHVDLSGSNLTGARLAGVDLTGVDLSGANLAHVETADLTLAHADLSGANLAGINLAGMDLSGADCSGSDLAGANLSGANLTKADLSGANLGNADLSHARLRDADLSGANLNGAKLDGADLTGADVSGTKLDKSKSE